MTFQNLQTRISNYLNDKCILNNILKGDSLSLKGLSGSLRSLFLSFAVEKMKIPWLIVLQNRDEAEILFEELYGHLNGSAVFFPGGDEEPDSTVIVNPRRAGLQMHALRGLLLKQWRLVVTDTEGLRHLFPSPAKLISQTIQLEVGTEINLSSLTQKLIQYGYTRESMVEKPGEISVRGGLLDIFPYTGELPHRIEFDGNRIDTMRIFDVGTQRSSKIGQHLILLPSPLEWKERTHSLLSFFNSGTMFIEDPDLVLGQFEKRDLQNQHSLDSRHIREWLKNHQVIEHHTLSSKPESLDLGGRSLRPLGRKPSEIRESLASLSDLGFAVYIVVASEEQAHRMQRFLEMIEDPIGSVEIAFGSLQRGFHIEEAKLIVYTESDIFGRATHLRRKRHFQEGVPIRELSALRRGDYVVHIDHGIGCYIGLEKIRVQENERECLAVEYQNGDRVYVPVEKMERVQKYSGREGVKPELNKLGSPIWQRQKERTKESIKIVAHELLEIYSARKFLKGHAFSPDSTWNQDLEASFPYDETPDQTTVFHAVREDMEQPRPMDRLICGDVGFGKTEIAIRAAFKAAMDGKQTAILVPTTILAQQHYHTFEERLLPFPVRIEVLSRFKSHMDQKKVVAGLKSGEIDIVIGTHRLLSKDVEYKDLGLLIIDEEHRFGVKHKEKLKALRNTVDVLALSATPIPRTLHFSLMGIRDVSFITTPPRDRLPIITEVLPFDENVIREAMNHEFERHGQVFFVHNRIHSIYSVARMLRRLNPGIRLAVAHGQMVEKELEKVMLDFTEKKYDCLVSTMIIGSGVNLPNVNTLIVNRADQFGLSQLYQLRGRVGRSEIRAYAYLLTPSFHLLNEDAVKRLRTIEEFTELGSGFQIALRDLEIRGAGHLLGIKQSGHIDAVGFDLYNRLMEEAVQELRLEKKESPKVDIDCTVDVHVPAFIPDWYVSEEDIRVNCYRKLSSFRQFKEIDEFLSELKDRFGSVPEQAMNLAEVVRIRILGVQCGLKRILVEDGSCKLLFHESWIDHFASSELLSNHLRKIIDSSQIPFRFIRGKDFGISCSFHDGNPLETVKKILQRWTSFSIFQQ